MLEHFSFAAACLSPHLAGLIACLLPTTSVSGIRQKLNDLAVDIAVAGVDNATGVGFPTYLDKASFSQMFGLSEAKNKD
jgi:hypothetical protein